MSERCVFLFELIWFSFRYQVNSTASKRMFVYLPYKTVFTPVSIHPIFLYWISYFLFFCKNKLIYKVLYTCTQIGHLPLHTHFKYKLLHSYGFRVQNQISNKCLNSPHWTLLSNNIYEVCWHVENLMFFNVVTMQKTSLYLLLTYFLYSLSPECFHNCWSFYWVEGFFVVYEVLVV